MSFIPLPITDPTWIFFVVLGVILFTPMLLERLRIPSIVGLIVVGVVIGPHGVHLLNRDASFEISVRWVFIILCSWRRSA